MSDVATISGAVLTEHTSVRLDFVSTESFEVFRARFEDAVPAFSPELVGEGDGWDAISERTFAAAPHAFLRYARLDGTPIFARAGHATPATTYLMGNHVFAELMFRHDPGILLYAPLRVAIFQDRAGRTHLSVDQPSGRFGSFGDPEIAATGRMLDERLADLVAALGLTGPGAA